MEFLPKDANILPPSDDRVFKLILTADESKPALVDLISTVIGRHVKDVVVRNNEIAPTDTQEKAERLDVNCRTDDNTQVNIEMCASRMVEESGGAHQNFKGKAVYYTCDLHSSQPSKGVHRYDKLAQTYQLTLSSYTIFPHRPGYLHSFSLRSDDDNELLSDAIHIIFVELDKLEEILKKPIPAMTDLEKWAIFFRYANIPECRDIVNDVIESKEALKVASERLMSISQDERERAIFRSRRMYQSDLESNLATAEDNGINKGIAIGRDEGIAIGRDEGIAIGRDEGIAIGRDEGIAIGAENALLSSIKSLMNSMHWTAEQAMIALAISPEKQIDYRKHLETQSTLN